MRPMLRRQRPLRRGFAVHRHALFVRRHRRARPERIKGRGGRGQAQNLAQDGFDTVGWVAKQDWSNGKVGTWGASALGRAQFETAQPASAGAGLLGSDRDGAQPELRHLLSRRRGVAGIPEHAHAAGLQQRTCTRPSLRIRCTMCFWRVLADRTYVKPQDIQVPMLLIGGWYDIFTDGVVDDVRGRAVARRRRGGACGQPADHGAVHSRAPIRPRTASLSFRPRSCTASAKRGRFSIIGCAAKTTNIRSPDRRSITTRWERDQWKSSAGLAAEGHRAMRGIF